MDDNLLKSILESEIDDAIGYLETETTDERQKALEYYMREPYGNEVPGKSQIVTGEVAAVSYTHLRAHETLMNLVCRLLLEKT